MQTILFLFNDKRDRVASLEKKNQHKREKNVSMCNKKKSKHGFELIKIDFSFINKR
jgi:hypothetical protein